MEGPGKIGHVSTKYAVSLNESYLSIRAQMNIRVFAYSSPNRVLEAIIMSSST